MAGDFVYVGDATGTLYALDRAGRRALAVPVGAAIYSSPVLDGGLLYIGNDDGAIYALHGEAGLRRVVTGQQLCQGQPGRRPQ